MYTFSRVLALGLILPFGQNELPSLSEQSVTNDESEFYDSLIVSETMGVPGIAPTPKFSHESGFYRSAINLVITAGGYDVHYTLDGSEPGPDDPIIEGSLLIDDMSSGEPWLSTIRVNPMTVDEWGLPWFPPEAPLFRGTVVRARTLGKEPELSSPVITKTFLLDTKNEFQFTLPFFSLVTDSLSLFGHDQGIYIAGRIFEENGFGTGHWGSPNANYWQRGEEWERPAHFEIIYPDDRSVFAQDIGIRMHGGASRVLPHKSFRLYARSTYSKRRMEHYFFPGHGKQAYNRLILRTSGQDFYNHSTMFRDAMIQGLFEHLDFDTQAWLPGILLINGEYWGIINLRERYDRHYLGRTYGIDSDQVDLISGRDEVKEGTADHFEFLMDYIRKNDLSDQAAYRLVVDMLDIDNFIDYNIAQIFANNTDWPANNREYWRLRTDYKPNQPAGHDGRWRHMMFDTDFGFGFYYGSPALPPYANNTLNMATAPGGMHWPNPDWSTLKLRKLLENDNFRNTFIVRFMNYMNTFLYPNRIVEHINSYADQIALEIDRHIHRWGYPASRNDWEANVENMREFGLKRREYQIAHLQDHFGLPDLFNLILDVDQGIGGSIVIDNMRVDSSFPGVSDHTYPWIGEYFAGLPFRIEAIPNYGYQFDGWKEHPSKDSVFMLKVDPGQSTYHLTARFVRDPTVTTVDVVLDHPDLFYVGSNYPNPFNSGTVIPFDIPGGGSVFISIYSLDGRQIFSDRRTYHNRGRYAYSLNTANLSTGVYIYQITFIENHGRQETHQGTMLLVR